MSSACASPARWFAEEVRPHEPALRDYLRKKFPTVSDVDDVVQESYLRAFLAWRKGRLTSVRGFLFTVASNFTVSLFRRRKYLSPVPVAEAGPIGAIDDGTDVPETICTREEMALVADAIAALPGRCRQVAVLRLLQGRDYADVAARLGISEQTVRVQVARAMRKCGQYLHERGVGAEGAEP